MQGFGISKETVSTGITPMIGGIQKAVLTKVKKEEVGKGDTKYIILSFSFKDTENIKSFKHSEFIIDITDEKYATKLNGFNARIKHIYEQYQPVSEEGIGNGATSFEDYFDKIEDAFNTGKIGKPIYLKDDGKHIAVWIKVTYDRKNNLQLPLFVPFIETINEGNITKSKTLVIDIKYDKTEQVKSAPQGNLMGGNQVSKEDDLAF